MRLIDADALIADCELYSAWDAQIVKGWLDDQPTIDIVRCKECIHHDIFGRTTKYYGCKYYNMAVDADHFCKKGERRADDGNL